MTILLPPDYLEQRADQIRRRERLQRRHPRERAVVARFDSFDSPTPRERLAGPPTIQAGVTTGGPSVLPTALPADIRQFDQVQRAAALQRAAGDVGHTGHTGMVDFSGRGFDD